jgi:flagellar hook-associated protein 1 FlgK
MATISGALSSAASALSVFDRVFDTIENNITNANTPGYAEQEQSLQPLAFDPATGLGGGVAAGPLLSTRTEYLEQGVRDQQQSLGYSSQLAGDLGQVQPLFDLTSTSGVANSLNSFFNTFSQLTVNPNDEVSRQAVITAAGTLAQNINQSAAGIEQVSTNATSQTTTVVTQINQLASQIASINQQFDANSQTTQDESLDSDVHNALETLSGLANISVIRTASGAYNVYLGGQTPLVLGDTVAPISTSNVSGETAILDANGNDISSQITSGQLGALVQENNTTLPGYLSNLNQLAQSLADTVNTTLSNGVDSNGNAGAPLFSYDQASDAASTITATNITSDQLAAASSTAPGGNDNAVALTQLATTPEINGFTFTQFYGNLGAQVGSDVASAQQNQTQAQDQLTQAQAQRSAVSGVDINTEAAQLLQFQQAYTAVGKLVSVLQDLTTTIIDAVQPTAT